MEDVEQRVLLGWYRQDVKESFNGEMGHPGIEMILWLFGERFFCLGLQSGVKRGLSCDS